MSFDVMAALADEIDQLTNPFQSRERRWEWDPVGHRRKHLDDHVVTLPGLVTQVGDIVWPGGRRDGDFHVRPVPASRPPGDPQASACYMDIHIGVTRWHLMLALVARDTIESSIRQLLSRVASEDRDTQEALLDDVRSWRYRCEIVTGLATPDPQLQVPCPIEECGQRTLRINVAKKTARCTSCRARWAEQEDEWTGNIGVLARWIQDWQAHSKGAADSRREAERERKNGRAA